MKISVNWLKDYIDLPDTIPPEQIAYDLTMSTVEVEEVIDLAKQYDQMCVGKVVEVKQHPNADKLKVVVTDLGPDGTKNIICGGINLKADMYVAVAKPGAKVRWHGEGDLIELKASKIRGEESFGMICSSEEINLLELYPQNDPKEIIDLSARPAEPGTPLSDYLEFNDLIIDIDNKSLTHRPDLWCHHGIARELATIYSLPLKTPEIKLDAPSGSDSVKVDIENPEKCHRYTASVIDNIEVVASPFYIQSRLIRVGQRPINLFVDLTNYVMFALGQPMHTFDAAEIKDQSIKIRQAKAGEILTLLNDSEIKLSPDDLVIAHADDPVLLAGVMGGKNSGVSEETKKIILEVAHFNPTYVRKVVARYGERTESSMRYDKGVDPERVSLARDYFIALLKEIQPEMQLTSQVDEYPRQLESIIVNVEHDFINERIGREFSAEEITKTLTNLGFEVSSKNSSFEVKVPDWRATGDVSIPEDIVEEVARLYGFDNLESYSPSIELTHSVSQTNYDFERNIREYLAYAAGLNEVFTYPWMEQKEIDAVGLDTTSAYELFDPPSPEANFIKTSLLPNLLQAAQKNTRYFESFGLFEIGRIFLDQKDEQYSSGGEKLPYQPKILAGVIVEKDAKQAFLKVKGIVEGLLKLSRKDLRIGSRTTIKYAKANTATAIVNKEDEIGRFCLIADRVLAKASIKHVNLAYFEIEFDRLLGLETSKVSFEDLPKFPETFYELSVVFDHTTAWSEIIDTVKASDDLIKDVLFADEYQGKQLPKDKKSISFKMCLADPNATLTSEQADDVADKVLKNLASKHQGSIRK